MKEIPLTRGYVALVDDGDYAWLSQFSWRVMFDVKTHSTRVYAGRGAHSTVMMHREILGAPKGVLVDHKNGDGLNNQRGNLRFCTVAQNAANVRSIFAKSGFKGVYPADAKRGWRAKIGVNGRNINLGTFPTAEGAAAAYDDAATEYFGEFAATNAALGLLPGRRVGALQCLPA